MSRPKVLYVSHLASLSGAEQALVRLLSHLDRDAFEPVAALPEDGPLRERLEALGVRTRVLPLAWWIPATHWSAAEYRAQLEGLPDRVDGLTALAREEGAALIHTNTLVTLEGALAAARLGLPHVWHSRGLFGQGSPPAYHDDRRFFLSIVDRLSDAVLCISRAVEEQTLEVCRRAAVRVVPDGFDAAAFLARPKSNWRFEGRVVLSLGGIQRRKGQLDLVEAAARLAPEFPDLVVALCGPVTDPEYAAEVERRIAERGLGGRVRLLGFQEDVAGLLAHAELLVQPSHSEGFGLAALEAMAMGKPVVATRCGGFEEIVEDGISGLLVPVGDPDALANAVRAILSDPDRAAALGRAAVLRSRAFGLEATARKTEAVYRDVLGTNPARGGLVDAITEEVLTRGRLCDSSAPPPPERTPRPGSWFARLRKHFE